MRKCLIAVLGVTLLLWACKEKGDDPELKAPVTIKVEASSNAKSGGSGIGKFTVTSNKEIAVNCSNCGPGLDLNFKSGNDAGSIQTADFKFPYVEKTYLCKLNLEVLFADSESREVVPYGLYLCPVGNAGERNCDLNNAMETCRLN